MPKITPAAPLNLNTAALEQLTQLPGVGPALARRIIAARPFQNVRDLIMVDGVGPRLYAGLLPLLTLEDAPASAPTSDALPPSATASEDEQPSEATPRPKMRRARAQHSPAEALPQSSLAAPDVDRSMTAAQPEAPEADRPMTAAQPEAAEAVAFEALPPFTTSTAVAPPIRSAAPRGRIVLALFYSLLALALVALFIMFYAALRPTPGAEVAGAPAGPSRTLPAPAISTVIEGGLAASVTPSEGPAAQPSQALAAVTAPSATPPPPSPSATMTAAPPTDTLMPSASPTDTSTPTASAPPTRTPSPTIAASPTPAPTAPAGAGNLLFAEAFNPPSFYWGVGNTNFSHSFIRGGQLSLTVDRAALGYVFGSMERVPDFYYQARTRPGACQAGDNYGLQVRARDDVNFYLFGVTCEGRVRVQVVVNSVYALLANTPPNPAIQTGEGAENVLAVRAQGADFQFIVNGQTVATVQDKSLTSGKFGLYARSLMSASFSATFSDVLGWAPTP